MGLYRLVVIDRNGERAEIERVSLRAIQSIASLVRDNADFPKWCIVHGRGKMVSSPDGNLEYMDVMIEHQNWLAE